MSILLLVGYLLWKTLNKTEFYYNLYIDKLLINIDVIKQKTKLRNKIKKIELIYIHKWIEHIG